MGYWIIPNLLSAALATGLLTVVLVRRPVPPLWPVVPAGIAATVLFAWGDVLSTLVGPSPFANWLTMSLLYAGLVALAPSWWILALRFGEAQRIPLSWGRHRLARLPVLFAAIVLPLALTHPWHDLLFTAIPGQRSVYHLGWYVFASGNHLIIAGALLLFLRHALRAQDRVARTQALVLALATALPAASNVLYTLSPVPLPFDPTPIGLCGASLLLIGAIHRQRLFGLSPFTLASLLDSEPDAMLLVDDAHRLLRANPAARQILGDEATRPGAHVPSAVAPFLGDALRGEDIQASELVRLVEKRTVAAQTPRYRFRNPDCRWVRISATALAADRSGRRGYCLYLRDRTALEEAREAAAAQASVLEGVLSSSDEGILVVDDRGRVPYVNDEYLRLFGIERDGIEQQGASALAAREAAHVEDPETHLRSLRELVENKAEVSVDELLLTDGRRLERNTRPLLRGGAPHGRVWRFRDVTASRRASAQIQHARELEALGVMAGGIAHDFNNVLAALLANLDLAASEVPDGSTASEYLSAAEKAIDRASELTQQLLACAGLPGCHPETMDLTRLVSETTAGLRPELPAGMEIRVELQRDLPPVVTDRDRLRQVVTNLVQNSVEARNSQSGRITIRTKDCELDEPTLAAMDAPGGASPGRYCCVMVEDDGIGMCAETLRRACEPFFTTKPSSSGLGLSVVRGIVGSLRGTLQLDSEEGAGCQVAACLPAAVDMEQLRETGPARPSAEGRSA